MAADNYVYILYRENGITPFYVGKGRGRRWMSHERHASETRHNTYKLNIIRQILAILPEVPNRKVAEGLTPEAACTLERELIAFIGRKHDGGPLVNMTAGGEGALDPTPESRERMRLSHLGKTDSEETREKKSVAMSKRLLRDPEALEKARLAANESRRGMTVPQEVRDVISVKLTGRKNGPPSYETRQKISAALIGKTRPSQSAESNAKRSASLKLSWSEVSPEQRSNRGMAGRKHSEETKEKMRAAARGRVISKEHREAISRTHTGRIQTKGEKERRAESLRKRWKEIPQKNRSPETRARNAEAARKSWLMRRGVP